MALLTQEQIEEAVKGMVPDIMKGLKKELTYHAEQHAYRIIKELTQEVVTQWMNEEVIPAMKKELVESKDGIISVAPRFAKVMTDTLVEGMVEDLKKNLEQSWTRNKIFEALFK